MVSSAPILGRAAELELLRSTWERVVELRQPQLVTVLGSAGIVRAVARAVMDSVSEGVISKSQANDLCILVGVFIHWQAEDDQKIYQYNYQAVKESIARALQGKPTVDEVLQKYKAARHPFASGAEG